MKARPAGAFSLFGPLQTGLALGAILKVTEDVGLHARACPAVFDFLNAPEEDIYTLAEGAPFKVFRL